MSCGTRFTVTTVNNIRRDMTLEELLQDPVVLNEITEALLLDELFLDDLKQEFINDDVFTQDFVDNAFQDPEALGDLEYNEISRTTEEVEIGTAPNTVTIERMTSVTFERLGGGLLTLNFDNPPVP